jgi:hypothetical protein
MVAFLQRARTAIEAGKPEPEKPATAVPMWA